MKPTSILPIAALLAALLPAQTPQPAKPAQPAQPVQRAQPAPKTPEELTKLRAEKLAKPVFQKAAWIADYDEARAQAKKDGKLIFAYFTRSYAA
jgi:hypothetical protein